MIQDSENVARAIFSPSMIVCGLIQPEAFRLRSTFNEEYISVARMSVACWENDLWHIPQRKNRRLYGYARMNTGSVRRISLVGVEYDIRDCSEYSSPSHAGIYITVNGEPLIGGKQVNGIEPGVAQDFMLLAIQRELVDIAQQGLVEIADNSNR